MNHSVFGVLVLVMNLIIGGCSHSTPSLAQPTSVPMTVIASGLMANVEDFQPGGVWVADQKQLDALTARIAKGSQLPAPMGGLPDINFAEEGLLFMWMGRKPTGGYAMELTVDRAEIENHTALVPARWVEPGKGAVLAQVITNPYLLLRLGKADYDTIRIVDTSGSQRVVVQTHTAPDWHLLDYGNPE